MKAYLDRKQEEKEHQIKEDIEGEGEVIDEEEFEHIKKMKELKKQYRADFEKLKTLKGEIAHLQMNID